jgi:diamine N-acetyltransferase
LDWNEPSIRFYRNLGAVAMDEWKIFRVTGPALSQLAESR